MPSGPFGRFLSGPNAILIRLRPGISPAAGLHSMQSIRRQLTGTLNSPRAQPATGGVSLADTVDLLPVQRPAEIVNYADDGRNAGGAGGRARGRGGGEPRPDADGVGAATAARFRVAEDAWFTRGGSWPAPWPGSPR